jgi:5-methylcytosine-specific restriction endonuclease McrA
MGDEPSGRDRQQLLGIVCPPGSVCHLCGEPIKFGLRPCHPLGPSMDHLVPRSFGGGWDLGNLRPAHHGCNSSRGNKPLDGDEDVHSQEW